MKKMKIFSLLFLLSSICIAQNSKTDTTRINETPYSISTFFDPMKFYPTNYFEKELAQIPLYTKMIDDSSSIFLQTKMQLSFLNQESKLDKQNNLLSPLYQKYAATQRGGFIRQVLGAVQLGAVGILAYKHIDKYYIKKKK